MRHARKSAGDVDLSAARALIDEIAGDGASVTFQTFAEREGSALRPSVKHGTLARHAESLIDANRAGAGIFFTVNETNLRGRKATDIVSVRAVFADFDGVQIPDFFPLRPHAVVETSPEKWHVYWRCSISPTLFKGVQQSISQRFGSDRAVTDLPRVLRLPGFWHVKGTPFQTRIQELNDFPKYTDDQIIAAFPIVDPHPLPKQTKIVSGSRNTELFKLAQLWHRQGADHDLLLKRLRNANLQRCQPPLEDSELRGIAHRQAAEPRKDKLLRPLAFMDSPSYLGLGFGARSLLNEAERFAQLQGNGNVALTESMLVPRGYSPNTIKAGIKALMSAGFIERTRLASYGLAGQHKHCALYRVTYL